MRPDDPSNDLSELIVSKHRNGPVGMVNLRFQSRYTRFVDDYASARNRSVYPAAVSTPTATATVVVGAQWGDEGKGKIVDLLAERFDVVARYQGGNNAGHTVQVGRRDVQVPAAPRAASCSRASAASSATAW